MNNQMEIRVLEGKCVVGNRIILTVIMSLLFILVGCGPQVQNQIDTQGEEIIEEPTKPDLVSLSRKIGIETLVLPDISEMASYTDIEVRGETIRFKYKNMTFVESVNDLRPEDIVGGLVVQEKQILLANGVKAKWILVSNHMDNKRGASAGLYLTNYGTNVAIVIGSMEPVKESETQAVAEALYYKQITNTSR